MEFRFVLFVVFDRLLKSLRLVFFGVMFILDGLGRGGCVLSCWVEERVLFLFVLGVVVLNVIFFCF